MPFTKTWLSYKRIEPMSTPLALTIDTVNTAKFLLTTDDISNKWVRVMEPLQTLIGSTKGKSYLKGLSDIIKVSERVENHGDLKTVGRWFSNFGASWVPNIVRHVGKAGRAERVQRDTWGDDEDFRKRLWERTLQKTEVIGPDDTPLYDVWGRRERESSMGMGPATDFFWRLMSPVYATQEDVFVGDLVLYRYNAHNPDAPYIPDQPTKEFTFNREKYSLSDEEYADYAKLSGELARRYVSKLKLNPDKPTKQQVDNIKKFVKLARDHARKKLKPVWLGHRLRRSK